MVKGVLCVLAFAVALCAGRVDAAQRHLCINGHPTPRDPGVTYGGLQPRHGFERDHIIPLCLGGPDTPENVQYQPLAEAIRKDIDERRLCEAYCHGDISLQDAIDELSRKWQR